MSNVSVGNETMAPSILIAGETISETPITPPDNDAPPVHSDVSQANVPTVEDEPMSTEELLHNMKVEEIKARSVTGCSNGHFYMGIWCSTCECVHPI